jgi:hypothetical protein
MSPPGEEANGGAHDPMSPQGEEAKLPNRRQLHLSEINPMSPQGEEAKLPNRRQLHLSEINQ